ncbi:glycerol-3-phosphate dehydrogenase/oxidase [Patulibacter sp.]|uniref:glycerol-3-phosphate dehydrogenase/oxidase n=1 Tax=Patulibacter sp. TaxID=1912859 RepID=UPI00271C2586|nr:glycerol-3-phosphate dehydrogenase/oxidase [Patulibacter sp.]MDO9410336.1 glycerol-3-phosphate dehydrogenase/oxidase [Patulibacter sp.]
MTRPVPGSLNVARRRRDLEELGAGAPVDLLVVGGGITGAGVALDAASRGLRTVLVERHDLAAGTSRWSSKLVHGGLRYLASGDVGLALESARERHVLMTRTAPHLVRSLPYVVPLDPAADGPVPRRRAEALATRVGLVLGDVLRGVARTPSGVLPRSRRIGAAEAARLVPGMAPLGPSGALLAWDGQLEDDARLVVAVARTAAAAGARILTGATVRRAAPGDVELVDDATGEALHLTPRAVVNATGAWAGGLDAGVRLRPSRGTHLVLAPGALGGPLGAQLSIPVPGSFGRFLLAIPRPDGTVLLGLTDEPVDGPVPDVPVPTDAEVDALLRGGSAAFRRPLGRDDVVGAFAGLRPLVAGAGEGAEGRTADLSRHHVVRRAASGAVTVTGGKLTTYRRMAQDAVDLAVAGSGLDAGPCRTTDVPLVGAAPVPVLRMLRVPGRLVDRHGTQAPAVAALAAETPELGLPVVPGEDVLRAELTWAVRHEGARTVEDLLDRRTRLGLRPAVRAAAVPAAERALDAADDRRPARGGR